MCETQYTAAFGLPHSLLPRPCPLFPAFATLEKES